MRDGVRAAGGMRKKFVTATGQTASGMRRHERPLINQGDAARQHGSAAAHAGMHNSFQSDEGGKKTQNRQRPA